MQYVRLGASGLKVSRIALGMMTFGTPAWRPWVREEPAARPVVKRAVELGINFFDTADMYSAGLSEEITGRMLAEYARRDEVVIATKLYFPVDLAFKGGNDPGPKPVIAPNASGCPRLGSAAANASSRSTDGNVKATNAANAPPHPARNIPSAKLAWLLPGPGRNWHSATSCAYRAASSHPRRSTISNASAVLSRAN